MSPAGRRTEFGYDRRGFLEVGGMSLLGLASYDQQIVTGAVIFFAASADGLLRRLRRLRVTTARRDLP